MRTFCLVLPLILVVVILGGTVLTSANTIHPAARQPARPPATQIPAQPAGKSSASSSSPSPAPASSASSASSSMSASPASPPSVSPSSPSSFSSYSPSSAQGDHTWNSEYLQQQFIAFLIFVYTNKIICTIVTVITLLIISQSFRSNFFRRFVAWASLTWYHYRQNTKKKQYNSVFAWIVGTCIAAYTAGDVAYRVHCLAAAAEEENKATKTDSDNDSTLAAVGKRDAAPPSTSSSSSSLTVPRSGDALTNSPGQRKRGLVKSAYAEKEGFVETKHRMPWVFRRRHATLRKCVLTFKSGDGKFTDSGSFHFEGGKVLLSQRQNTLKIVNAESETFHLGFLSEAERDEWREVVDQNLKAHISDQWSLKMKELKSVEDERHNHY